MLNLVLHPIGTPTKRFFFIFLNLHFSPAKRQTTQLKMVLAASIVVIIVVMGIMVIVPIVAFLKWLIAGPSASTKLSVELHPPQHAHVNGKDALTVEKFLQDIVKERPIRFSAQQIFSFTNNYETRLGSGGCGVVYKGELPNGLKIAVKVLMNKNSDKKTEEQFMAEAGTIGKTYHMNLVKLYGFCYDPYMSTLVYEYMENGSLDRYLFSDKKKIGFDKLHQIAVGTAKGLAYLHEECEKRIVHYDIKPGNVLLDAKFNPKVADFGLAKLYNRDDTHVSLTGYRGTPGYSAPEFMLGNFPMTHKCDVYSFGMLLFEILGRRKNANIRATSSSLDWFPKHVWDEYQKGELEAMTIACEIEEQERERAKRMAWIALWCVQDSPEARPAMSVVVRMLEGGMEIMPPSKPFNFFYPPEVNASDSQSHQDQSSISSVSQGTYSLDYKNSTPIMSKYEIQIASK